MTSIVGAIVGAIGLCACVTHTSRLALVRNIAVQPQGLVVETCHMELETTTDYTAWMTTSVSSKDYELTEGQCSRALVPTRVQ